MAQDRLARVIPSMHVHLCVALWLISLHPSPVFYFVPPFSFQPFQMFFSEFNERSRSKPLCDFRLGTVATSDHETPLTVSTLFQLCFSFALLLFCSFALLLFCSFALLLFCSFALLLFCSFALLLFCSFALLLFFSFSAPSVKQRILVDTDHGRKCETARMDDSDASPISESEVLEGASGSAAPEFIRLPECETTAADEPDGYWQRRGKCSARRRIRQYDMTGTTTWKRNTITDERALARFFDSQVIFQVQTKLHIHRS